ncbi:MAG: PIG-L family deacetylase [Chloroflexota bacterium]|nr:PIG-L family deacetylase [Chloroflexota bacterium]
MTSNHRPTLLAIFAHPDDESFGSGGTLAKYAAEGVDVHVCIVTDGAAGSYDEEFVQGYESIAQRRAEELERAAAVLGVTLHILNYRDSGMAGSPENEHPASLVQAPLEEVACCVMALIDEIQPHVVLTHDPTGGYFHPDHIKVNQAVDLAWEYLHDGSACPEVPAPHWQPDRLFWSALPRTWIRWSVRLMRLFRKDPSKYGRNKDIDLTDLGTPDDQIHTQIDVSDYLSVKREASRQHVSQGGSGAFQRWMPSFIQRWFFGREAYTQAYPPGPLVEDDFFEGLR